MAQELFFQSCQASLYLPDQRLQKHADLQVLCLQVMISVDIRGQVPDEPTAVSASPARISPRCRLRRPTSCSHCRRIGGQPKLALGYTVGALDLA